jgi:hypothetical protein
MFLEDSHTRKRDILDLRVLKIPEPGVYIIALKLVSAEAASCFIQELHQRRFNQIEPESCEVACLHEVTFYSDYSTTPDGSQISRSSSLTNQPQPPEALFSYENQQNCPICLESVLHEKYNLKQVNFERLRCNTGFSLTILCGHTFHWMCLKDWSDTTCPLCRYHASPQE